MSAHDAAPRIPHPHLPTQRPDRCDVLPLQIAGEHQLDPAATNRVAGTDWELEPPGDLVDADWRLEVRLDFPTIVREAIEEHLADDAPTTAP